MLGHQGEDRVFAVRLKQLALVALMVGLGACQMQGQGSLMRDPVFQSRFSNATLVGELRLPETSTIEGAVTAVGKGEFVLTDRSGSILVEMQSDYAEPPELVVGDWVRVAGILDEDARDPREFEAFSLQRPSGEKIHLVPIDF